MVITYDTKTGMYKASEGQDFVYADTPAKACKHLGRFLRKHGHTHQPRFARRETCSEIATRKTIRPTKR